MSDEELITLTIDGKTVSAKKGMTVLQIALENGIQIPHLCYHAKTGQAGLCRSCVVEIEGMTGLQTSCSVLAQKEMVVRSNTERVLEVRRMVVELLLSNGHHNCIACEKNGNCELQDAAYQLGIEIPSYPIEDKKMALDESSPGIVYDPNKCIQCFRCVKACNNIVMNRVLEMAWRANHSVVACDNGVPMNESSCVQCGECVQLCPVGALTEKQAIGKGRSYDMKKVQTTCPYCGVGCQIELHVKDNQIVRVYGVEGDTDNEGSLCVKGRFGNDFVNSPNRLTKPLLRKNGKLEEVEWEEAFDFTANKLLEIKDKYGPASIAGLASAKCTNEENYLFQKFMRAVIKTNNVDHCARL